MFLVVAGAVVFFFFVFFFVLLVFELTLKARIQHLKEVSQTDEIGVFPFT